MDKKIEKEIKLRNRKIAVLVFREDDKEINKITETVKKKYSKLRRFFDLTPAPIYIELVYSRGEIDEKVGRKTPLWLVGFADRKRKNYIYLVSPLMCEKISNHRKNDIYKVIVHELAHVFINKINKNALNWVSEGLALYLASQAKNAFLKKENWSFLLQNNFFTTASDWLSFAEHQGYNASYILVNSLMKEFGKNKVLKLIRINKNSKFTEDEFYNIFGIKIEDFVIIFSKI